MDVTSYNEMYSIKAKYIIIKICNLKPLFTQILWTYICRFGLKNAFNISDHIIAYDDHHRQEPSTLINFELTMLSFKLSNGHQVRYVFNQYGYSLMQDVASYPK